jgi:hypothetical protein
MKKKKSVCQTRFTQTAWSLTLNHGRRFILPW